MSAKEKDQIRIGPEVAPGAHLVTRRRGDDVRSAIIKRPKDGEAMSEGMEIVNISESGDDGWRDVRVLYRHGPAQVATPQYRAGYDRIFGKKPAVGLA